MVTAYSMPTTGVRQTEFKLHYAQAVNRLKSGKGFATTLAPDYWTADIETKNLKQGTSALRAWRGFLLRLRGAMRVALLYDADQPYPQLYSSFTGLVKAGTSTPFTGTGAVQSYGLNQLVLNGLPANFQLVDTDYVSFILSGRYSLHRINGDAQANTSGVVTINVEPAVPALFDNASTTFSVFRASGEFVLDPESVNAPRDIEGGAISFSATSRVF